MEVNGQLHAPAVLSFGKELGILMAGWVGLRVDLETARMEISVL
jgi:hypothetical protein